MKSSFCIDLQRFMLIPTKFPLTRNLGFAFPLRAGDLWFSPHYWTFDTPSLLLLVQAHKKGGAKLMTPP